MSLPADYFDQLYAGSDDPWQYRNRWYEQRKRDLTLASLPRAQFRHGFEPGCSIGELSAALATRCDRLLVCDGNARAVECARKRLGDQPHIQVEQRELPAEWPEDARFDLIVISEWAYYLSSEALPRLVALCLSSLSEDGVLLACHWRHRIEGCELDGDLVHAAFGKPRELHRLAHHAEEDFLLDVWTRDSLSVAGQEQLR